MPIIKSKFFSANARIAGSIEVGLPGSTSRKTMSKSWLARFTPSHAAALNERSFLPPMSKTMPTLILPLSATASVEVSHEVTAMIETKINKIDKIFIFLVCIFSAKITNSSYAIIIFSPIHRAFRVSRHLAQPLTAGFGFELKIKGRFNVLLASALAFKFKPILSKDVKTPFNFLRHLSTRSSTWLSAAKRGKPLESG